MQLTCHHCGEKVAMRRKVRQCLQGQRAESSPILVEPPLDLCAEMLGPDCVVRPEAGGCDDVSYEAHHDDRGCLNDGHSLHTAPPVNMPGHI